MDLRVCYVVNSVSSTSVPATIATALVDHEDLEVDILSWFWAEPFAGDDRVGVNCLKAPDTALGIDGPTYRTAREHLADYDLIQVHSPHSGSIAKLIGHQLGVPMVSREGNVRRGFTRKGRAANGLTNALVDRVVPNSRAVYESFTQWERLLLDEDDIKIIPNGVDIERIDRASNSEYNIHEQISIPAESVVVGTVSVMSEQKALDTLVRGFRQAVKQADQQLNLVIAGDGPLRSDLERLAAQIGIADQVHFTGMVDRETVYRILSEIDIYAMPSRWEGFSNAAVEALGAGNACVFSDIDPFLLPYRNVALFHRVDDIDDLASRLVELAEKPDLRELYGRRGRELIEQEYTLNKVAKQYTELYADIM
jgi:glycosyltransferase involved in cell wall biosynthesis